jgi:hypothetical protein
VQLSYSLADDSSDGCQWKFDHYSPSAWEMFWYNNIPDLQNKVCATLTQPDQRDKSIRTLQHIINLQKTIFNGTFLSNEYDELFSKMYYRFECSKSSLSTRIVSQYIEPLIGLLRDPLTVCYHGNLPSALAVHGDNAMQSKRFFLLGPSAPYKNFQPTKLSIAPWLYNEKSQKILIDIGSAYFNGVTAAQTSSPVTGARWFYEYFRLNSLQFDRIIAFESEQYSPKSFWNQIPDDLIGLFTFMNVDIGKTGKFNPWNMLKSIAKPNDYVIIKLDIDTPVLENEIIQQTLNDTSISSLVDEIFYEMHVRINEMIPYWGVQPGELKDSYKLFTKVRHVGIRMHSWP